MAERGVEASERDGLARVVVVDRTWSPGPCRSQAGPERCQLLLTRERSLPQIYSRTIYHERVCPVLSEGRITNTLHFASPRTFVSSSEGEKP